ncbi:DUF3817 domain-containing protein [Cryobacterium ruanii]|uniref:DUF3817 domain-containing protein n=1 Tax=Cryobacterium ruanii TaxID=1259197 RepID=A0A4R9AL31_9MICO|nr:DUF3817 domain-containing protein [Cryobacterium ruanii]TFD64407.1 DUF3817 domain-containing protein [Cryobacterium ruanii]
MTPRLLFRSVAIAETITWVLLIAGMLMKYGFAVGEIGVQVGGFLHGLVFIAFGLTALLVGVNQHWDLRLTSIAMATAIVPFATVPLNRGLEKNGLLIGGWRHTRTDDPRDHTPVSALLRWMLARPVVLAGIMAIALVTIMATLLTIGPPGGTS